MAQPKVRRSCMADVIADYQHARRRSEVRPIAVLWHHSENRITGRDYWSSWHPRNHSTRNVANLIFDIEFLEICKARPAASLHHHC